MFNILGVLVNVALFGASIGLFYVLILCFIAADLRAGIRKAKQNHVYRSSRGLRDTVDKICRYYNMAFALTLVDIAIVFTMKIGFEAEWCPSFPIFTLVAVVYVAFIEIKSIFEKWEDKERAKIEDATQALLKLSKDKDFNAILETIISAAKERSDNKNS